MPAPRPRSKTAALTVPVLLLLPALLTGCGDQDDNGTEDPGSSSTPSGGPTSPDLPDDVSASPTTPPPAGAEMTAPGTELSLGDPATVPLQAYGEEPSGVADVVVTAIEPVAADALAAAGGDGVEGEVSLIRVRLEVTEVADDFGPLQPSIDVTGLVEGRAVGKAPAEVDAALGCPPAALTSSTEPGEVVEFCVTAVTDPGAALTAGWATARSAYALDVGSPIVWAG